jgi:hypothetical protein
MRGQLLWVQHSEAENLAPPLTPMKLHDLEPHWVYVESAQESRHPHKADLVSQLTGEPDLDLVGRGDGSRIPERHLIGLIVRPVVDAPPVPRALRFPRASSCSVVCGVFVGLSAAGVR